MRTDVTQASYDDSPTCDGGEHRYSISILEFRCEPLEVLNMSSVIHHKYMGLEFSVIKHPLPALASVADQIQKVLNGGSGSHLHLHRL